MPSNYTTHPHSQSRLSSSVGASSSPILFAPHALPVLGLSPTFLRSLSLFISLLGVTLILRMPLRFTTEVPTPLIDGTLPALDDFATLGAWIAFSWINPLIARGKAGPLEASDVWQLSRRLRARAILKKWRTLRSVPLMRPAHTGS